MPLEIRPHHANDIVTCDYPMEYDWANLPKDLAVMVLANSGGNKVHGFVSYRFLHGGLILEIQKLGFRQDTVPIAEAVAKSLITWTLQRAFHQYGCGSVTATVSETDDIRIKIYSNAGFDSRVVKTHKQANDFIEFRKDIVRR